MPHVRFQVPFLGPESQLKSGFACAGLLCSAKRKGMAGLGVSRNDSPFVFCSVCPMFLGVFLLVCKCASGRLCHLEKIAFWQSLKGRLQVMLSEVSMVVVWVSAFGKKIAQGGWLILRHPNRDSCPEPLFFDLTNQVFYLSAIMQVDISWKQCANV